MDKKKSEFDDIRPFYDEEVSSVIAKLLDDSEFQRVVRYVFPDIIWKDFDSLMRTFNNKYDFQQGIIRETVFSILKRTATSAECSGFENIDRNTSYTYISNHRDIVLDACILCCLLLVNGYDTTEIAIGDNLLIQPWIDDLVRLNKSFIVKRGVSMKQRLEASMHLSEYIHFTINEKHQSIWIAQREGRAKNSDDKTQESLLKMLSFGGGRDFLKSIRNVNIAPLSLSYEYDPCDYLKAKEFQLKRDNPDYKKSPADDLLNMETGLFGFKGRIHFQIGRPVNKILQNIETGLNKNEQITALAHLIDKEIYLNYKFYPINYIAYDRLWGGNLFKDKYTSKDIEAFDTYIEDRLNLIEIPNRDLTYLSDKLLEMYAYPLKNNLLAKEL